MRWPSLDRSFVVIACSIVLLGAGAARADGIAPPFVLRTLDGKTLRSTELKGRPVILDFWAMWCAPCRASMPHLNTMQVRYRDRGLVVVGLSVDDEDGQLVKRFAERLGVTFRVGLADDRLLDQYGPLRAIPTTIFINRRGDVVRRVVGYIDGETLETYVLELF